MGGGRGRGSGRTEHRRAEENNLSRERAQKAQKNKSERWSQKDVFDSIFLTEGLEKRRPGLPAIHGDWSTRAPRGQSQANSPFPRCAQRRRERGEKNPREAGIRKAIGKLEMDGTAGAYGQLALRLQPVA